MPRKRRKAKATELTHNQFFDLWLGSHYGRWDKDGPFESPFARRAAWFANREELMEDCRAAHRPGGWWDYEVREPRPIVGKKERKDFQGRPMEVLCLCGEMHDGFSCEYESEESYLRRLGLLEPWEEAELEARKGLKGA